MLTINYIVQCDKYIVKVCIRILKIVEEGVINFAGGKGREESVKKGFISGSIWFGSRKISGSHGE